MWPRCNSVISNVRLESEFSPIIITFLVIKGDSSHSLIVLDAFVKYLINNIKVNIFVTKTLDDLYILVCEMADDMASFSKCRLVHIYVERFENHIHMNKNATRQWQIKSYWCFNLGCIPLNQTYCKKVAGCYKTYRAQQKGIELVKHTCYSLFLCLRIIKIVLMYHKHKLGSDCTGDSRASISGICTYLRIEFHSGCIYWIMNAMVKLANPWSALHG